MSDYYKQAFRKIETSNSKADSLTAEETIAEIVGGKLSKAWTRCDTKMSLESFLKQKNTFGRLDLFPNVAIPCDKYP